MPERRAGGRESRGEGFQGTNPEPVWDPSPIVRPDPGRAVSQKGRTLRANGRAAPNEWQPHQPMGGGKGAGEAGGRGINEASFFLAP